MPRRSIMPSLALAALALACLSSIASARRLAAGCTATGVSINGAAPYNFVCKGNMNFGGDGMICSGTETCYAASDVTCSGTPMTCPTEKTDGETPEMTGCSATGVSINGAAPYNFACKGNMNFGGDGVICSGAMTCYAASDNTCSGTPMTCPNEATDGKTPEMTGCSATGVSINGAAPYNFVCKGNMNFGGDGMTCSGVETCYAASDVTCSGTPMTCPTEKTDGETPEMTGCTATGVSINGAAPYNFVCKGNMNFGGDGMTCSGTETCYAAADNTCSGTPMTCPNEATDGETPEMTGCSATGVSINGAAPYNFVCKGDMNIGGDGMTCSGVETCYAASDMTCSGAPMDCPNGPSTMTYKYRAYLKGKKQIPKIVTKTWGWGYAEWSTDSTMAKITVEVKNAVDVFAAHVHNCSADCSGPVVVTIFNFVDADGTRLYTTGDIATSLMVDLATNPMLGELIMSGDAYVNVHSKEDPSGEVRGQLMDTASAM